MPGIVSTVITVSTSAGIVASGDGPSSDIAGSSLLVLNSGAVTVYLGGAGVTTSNGFPLAAGGSVSLDFRSPGDVMYAIAASAGQLRVLQVG